jgi:hypothetical protein
MYLLYHSLFVVAGARCGPQSKKDADEEIINIIPNVIPFL